MILATLLLALATGQADLPPSFRGSLGTPRGNGAGGAARAPSPGAVSGPGPAEAPPAPPDYQVRVLANGLTVLVVEDHGLPLVTVEICVRNGAMTESPAFNGLSHLYEHMFFKGNQALPNQEAFLDRTSQLGMVFNGGTETERVNYYFTTTSDEFAPALTLLKDSIESPLFDPVELSREEQVVIGEIDRNDADPFYHFGRAMDLLMWKFPSYKDPLGNRETVAAATPEKLRLIQSRYYVPNNSALVIAGDVEPAAAFALADKLLSGWRRGADPFLAHPIVEQPPLTRSAVVVLEQPVQSLSLGFQWHGPSASPQKPEQLPDTYAADLLSAVVLQPGSSFQRALVDSGACVRADLGWITEAHVGPVTYGLEAAPDRVDACLSAAVAELPRLLDPAAITDQELAHGRVQLEVRKALEREATSSYAHLLTYFWASTGLEYYDGYLAAIARTGRPQIDAFLRRWVLGEPGQPRPPYVFGAMVSPELAKAQGLTAAHFRALLGLPTGDSARDVLPDGSLARVGGR